MSLKLFKHFGFEEYIANLDKADRAYLIVSRFCYVDLHPYIVSNIEMSFIFKDLQNIPCRRLS